MIKHYICVCAFSMKRVAKVYNSILLALSTICLAVVICNVRILHWFHPHDPLSIAGAVFIFVDIVVCSALYGLQKKKAKFLYPYLFTQAIAMFLILFAGIYCAFVASVRLYSNVNIHRDDIIGCAVLAVISTLFVAVNSYFGFYATNCVRISIESELKKKAESVDISMAENIKNIELCEKECPSYY